MLSFTLAILKTVERHHITNKRNQQKKDNDNGTAGSSSRLGRRGGGIRASAAGTPGFLGHMLRQPWWALLQLLQPPQKCLGFNPLPWHSLWYLFRTYDPTHSSFFCCLHNLSLHLWASVAPKPGQLVHPVNPLEKPNSDLAVAHQSLGSPVSMH